MRNIKPIKNRTFIIESVDKNNNYSYSILANNEIKPLIEIEDVDSLTTVRYTFNDYYLIIYTCSIRKTDVGPKIELAYDLEKNQILDLDNNFQFEYALENMFLFAQHFDKAVVLQAINEKDLGVCSKENLDEFFNFMKESNDEITNEYVVNSIINRIPELKKYMNIQKPLSYMETIELLRSMPTIYLNSVPQKLDFIEHEYQLSKTKKSNGR